MVVESVFILPKKISAFLSYGRGGQALGCWRPPTFQYACESIHLLFVCLCFFQAAQSVLISLFELNTPEFTMLLGALPKTFQDGATKLLHNHLRNTGNGTQVFLTCLLLRFALQHVVSSVYSFP